MTFTGKDKKEHTIHYQVMREYLTVGNTRDHVIVPLIPATAQKIADTFGCILPTRKMVDQIFNAAPVKLSALPRDYWMQGQIDKSTGKKVPTYDPTKDKKLVTHDYDEYLKKPDCQISTASYLEHDLAIRQQLKSEAGIVRGNDMPLVAGHKPVTSRSTWTTATRLVAGTMLADDREMTAAEVLNDDLYADGLNTNGRIERPRVPNVPVP